FYLLARRLYGAWVALLALALVMASRTQGFEGLIEYGRQALGEVPGLAFLLLGVLAWIKGLDSAGARTHVGWTVVAGLGFGLALVTKNQFVLIVPPTLVLLALLDWLYYRAGSWWLRLAPVTLACACFGAWTLIQLMFLGPGTFAANLAQTRQAAGGAIFVFDLTATLRAAKYIVQVYGGLLLPALICGLWRCRARTPAALAELLIMLMAALWLAWYGISLGWPRYAFPAVALGALATARMVTDLFGWLCAQPRLRLMAGPFAAYTALAIIFPLTLTAQVVFSPDDSAQRFAAYLNANVAQAALVETWEPELGVLTDHRYHYPPIELLDLVVRQTWLGGEPPVYNPLEQHPDYVVIGTFGDYTQIYTPDSRYQLQSEIGPYRLYRIAD
ncbi:MAG: glycosyl transferase, partial [Chloroflexales bacterium]|nr:glycosyl transferase [Chloroflexales bacterium]